MTYNLLIVDDEPEIVAWLVKLFRIENIADLAIYSACSSKDALRILNTTKVDVVISDIKMPGMSGMELLKRIKDSWPLCKVILLTGYMEFDYVYTAIKSNNVRYLLKTEKDAVIIGAVRNALLEIETSFRDEKILENAKKQMDKIIPLLQKEFFQDLKLGLYDSTHLTGQVFDELQLPFKPGSLYIMILGIFDCMPQPYSAYSLNSNFNSVRYIAEKYLPSGFPSACFTDEELGMVWIIQAKAEDEDAQPTSESELTMFKGVLEYIQTSVRKNLDLTMSFAISSKLFPMEAVQESYNRLKTLISYYIGLSTEMLISDDGNYLSNNIASNDAKKYTKATNRLGTLKLLDSYIETNRQSEFLELLKYILEPLAEVKSRNFNPALEIYYTVAVVFLKHINRLNLTEKLAPHINLHLLTRADLHESWGKAVQYLLKLAETVFIIISDEKSEKASGTVQYIIQFIHKNLQDDLTLYRLADLVHVNASYLSRLFKNEIGVNITDYIADVRIDRAKELLRDEKKRIVDISAEIGYTSHNSFARFFKNSTGMTPQEYRSSF